MIARPIRVFGVLVLAAGLTTGAILASSSSGSSAKKPKPAKGGAEDAVGVHFAQATPPANALSRAAAIAAAGGHGYLADPAVKVRAVFGIATDTEYYLERRNGKRHYYVKDRPVWIVSFTGPGTVPDMGGGPRPPGSQSYRERAEPNREMNVVIDGFTGKELEDYSYR